MLALESLKTLADLLRSHALYEARLSILNSPPKHPLNSGHNCVTQTLRNHNVSRSRVIDKISAVVLGGGSVINFAALNHCDERAFGQVCLLKCLNNGTYVLIAFGDVILKGFSGII